MAAQESQLVESQQFTDVSEYQFKGDSYTVERKRTFITMYREHGSIYHAAFHTPVSRKTVYNWLEADEEFAEAVADSRDDSLDDLESSVYKRAFKSDLLAMFYLKAHRPKFRDKVSIDIDSVRDEIQQRMSQLGLERVPAMITSGSSDGYQVESTESTQSSSSHLLDQPALEQKN